MNRRELLARCQRALPGWAHLTPDDIRFADPKGFSSVTSLVEAPPGTDPPAVFYRRLEGKHNAVLGPEGERATFRLLAAEDLAAPVLHDGPRYRLEGAYRGRTLTAADLFDEGVLAGIGAQLARFHRLPVPAHVPAEGFFTLLHRRWAPLAERVLAEASDRFPPEEQAMCATLRGLLGDDTRALVARRVPDSPRLFCHNDVYHGNVMAVEGRGIRLLDFEFSCLNHPAFDFANLFAETVMVHGLPEPPHFRIGEPAWSDRELRWLIGAYLAHAGDGAGSLDTLVAQTRRMVPLSDYVYAMAAIPLAVRPIQRIRFLPYALQRYRRFLAAPE